MSDVPSAGAATGGIQGIGASSQQPTSGLAPFDAGATPTCTNRHTQAALTGTPMNGVRSFVPKDPDGEWNRDDCQLCARQNPVPSPVHAGARVRGHVALEDFRAIPDGDQTAMLVTIEAETSEKPPCVALLVTRLII